MPAVATYLDRIVAAHRSGPRPTRVRSERSIDAAVAAAPDARALRRCAPARKPRTARLAVIAEIKRRSPSKGDLAPDLDPADAGQGLRGRRRGVPLGAHRRGVLRRIRRRPRGGPRGAADLPVLRKDFTVGARDVCDARLMGADAVLLIVAALDRRRAGAGSTSSPRELGLDALVEVHDERELERALGVGADARSASTSATSSRSRSTTNARGAHGRR